MYDNILYPTDGSEGASAALTHAHNLAETYGATVHILHVVNSSYLGYESEDGPTGMLGKKAEERRSGMSGSRSEGKRSGMVGGDPKELQTELRERCNTVVEEVAAQFEGVDTEPVVRVGNPHEIVVEYAAQNEMDIIVMGTHGRTGVDRYLLGSVAEKVVRMSDVPVVTVRKGEETEPEPETEA